MGQPIKNRGVYADIYSILYLWYIFHKNWWNILAGVKDIAKHMFPARHRARLILPVPDKRVPQAERDVFKTGDAPKHKTSRETDPSRI